MTHVPLLVALSLFAQAACLTPSTIAERHLQRSFRVAADSLVSVDLSGGTVTILTGPDGVVEIDLLQEARTTGDERAAAALLEQIEATAVQEGDQVRLAARRRRATGWTAGWSDRIRLEATVTVPASARLDLDTSGGRITVRGDRAAEVQADTSGGSIRMDGGAGSMVLVTSGGSITVGRALGALRAGTSGGSITVGYVGPSATDVDLDTSGGSIRVGIDPDAAFTLTADTSGGSVRIRDLPFQGDTARRSHASGTINGGGNRLRASTSGGSITIRASSAAAGAAGSPVAPAVSASGREFLSARRQQGASTASETAACAGGGLRRPVRASGAPGAVPVATCRRR